MLIRRHTLDRVKTGEVTLAFRRWKKPTVKSGGTLKTAIGLLNIEDVKVISLKVITETDAKRAGFNSKNDLKLELSKREGQLYRIVLEYAGADPRIELREKADLSEDEINDVLKRLTRMDARSTLGDWTLRVLSSIEQHPKTLAATIAIEIEMDKVRFKSNVRKLKNLGLTISHQTGYSLSPRGKVVLKRIRH